MTQEIYIHAKVKRDKTSKFIQICHFEFSSIGATINFAESEQYWKDTLCDTVRISYCVNCKLTLGNWKTILKRIISIDPEVLLDNDDELELGSYPLLGSDSIWMDCIIPKVCIEV